MSSSLTHPAPSASGRLARPLLRALNVGARILLGLVFFVCGLNGFLNFIPPPSTPMPEQAMAFIGALVATGYMLPLVAGTQVVGGALLLANRFVPLALILLAPVVVNIVALHLFLERSGLVIATVVLALEIYLLWLHRRAFRSVLAARA